MANEVAVSGKSEAEVNAFLDKILSAMVTTVKAGLAAPDGDAARARSSSRPRPATSTSARMDDKYEAQRGVGVVSAYALAGSEENARGHLVVTAPDRRLGRRHAGARLRARRGRRGSCRRRRSATACWPPRRSAISCKHNATLSGAEGGCQAEIGVASAMGAALIAQAHDFGHQVVANAAESSLEHHLGMTCDPVAGFVQIPCIERCAFGAVKAWTGFMIASNEIPANRRVDFDTTVTAMALTAKEMNSKYKETSEGGLAVSVVALLSGAMTATRPRRSGAARGRRRVADHGGVLLLPVRRCARRRR